MAFLWFDQLLSFSGPLVSVFMIGSLILTKDYISVWLEPRLLRQSLEQGVSPEIMAEIMASPDGYLNQVGGVRKNVSILFSDMRGFTSLSEKMEPEQLVALLNEYLEAMVGAILSDKGMVVTFIGDAVMAVFQIDVSPLYITVVCFSDRISHMTGFALLYLSLSHPHNIFHNNKSR